MTNITTNGGEEYRPVLRYSSPTARVSKGSMALGFHFLGHRGGGRQVVAVDSRSSHQVSSTCLLVNLEILYRQRYVESSWPRTCSC